MDRMTGVLPSKASPRATPEQLLLGAQGVCVTSTWYDRVKDYIVDVVFATREPQKKGHEGASAADRIRRKSAREHRPQLGPR